MDWSTCLSLANFSFFFFFLFCSLTKWATSSRGDSVISGTHWVSHKVERRGVGATSRDKDREEKGARKAAEVQRAEGVSSLPCLSGPREQAAPVSVY